MAERNVEAKLKKQLKQDKIQLWKVPYSDDAQQPGRAHMQELAERYAALLRLPGSEVAEALEVIRVGALKRGERNQTFRESGVATVELLLPPRDGGKKSKMSMETRLDVCAQELMDRIAEEVGLASFKVILNGRTLNAGQRLDQQGVGNHSRMMVLKAFDAASAPADVGRAHRGFRILSERDGSDDLQDAPFLEVADQKGTPLKIPQREKKALILAMGLHEKGRALMKRKRHDDALCHLLQADVHFRPRRRCRAWTTGASACGWPRTASSGATASGGRGCWSSRATRGRRTCCSCACACCRACWPSWTATTFKPASDWNRYDVVGFKMPPIDDSPVGLQFARRRSPWSFACASGGVAVRAFESRRRQNDAADGAGLQRERSATGPASVPRRRAGGRLARRPSQAGARGAEATRAPEEEKKQGEFGRPGGGGLRRQGRRRRAAPGQRRPGKSLPNPAGRQPGAAHVRGKPGPEAAADDSELVNEVLEDIPGDEDDYLDPTLEEELQLLNAIKTHLARSPDQ
ncbi:NEDD8 ultimate buster 1 isoform X4 [Syngnathoides biaculeatus]|uniref:NEDD8 ultimate buster 1 isoform X4 n=1 Tax=Syngnathoides biaculeatus TaxID=300417 RepID=UPI002ADD6149|nr:NEDD8 ultimate buster 1 isoform X4 [Syngnathoides biaculeatus]